MDRKDKKEPEPEPPIDLAARIGARSEPPAPPASEPDPRPNRHDAALPPRREPRRRKGPAGGEDASASAPKTPLGPGEVDLVVTPLPTPDDAFQFEMALRRLAGVGEIRTEYFRHGVLKMRVSYNGPERLASALREGVPGYSVRVVAEDASTLQILVITASEESTPS